MAFGTGGPPRSPIVSTRKEIHERTHRLSLLDKKTSSNQNKNYIENLVQEAHASMDMS